MVGISLLVRANETGGSWERSVRLSVKQNIPTSNLLVESLDELAQMVVKNFSPIKNRAVGRTPLMLEDPRGTEHNGVSHTFGLMVS